MKKFLLVVLCGLLLALLPLLISRASAPGLLNPDFEEGFTNRGPPEVNVAKGWNWWALGVRPEFQAESLLTGKGRVYEGTHAQKTFTTYARHDGGLVQSIDGLEENNWYEFGCHVYNWCSGQDNPDVSIGGKCFSMVGVNPWGNSWPADWTTIWGKAALDDYNRWVDVTVIFQAWSPRAALFTRGLGEWPIKHQDWYWDSCYLKEYATPGPSPDPSEGATLDQIREVVATVVAERDPVRWPR